MLTGRANTQEIVNAVNHANLYRYIGKPWEIKDLVLTVSGALESYFKDKQLEKQNEQLKQMNAQLQVQANELSVKNKILVKLNQEKNEFLSIAAHDLKNPLSSILTASEEIKNAFDDYSKEEVIRFAELIHMGSEKMFQLIINLLDVNKIEAGQLQISPYIFDILPILNRLLTQYTQKAKLKNIKLHCQYSEKQYVVFVDKQLAHQVLDNLISNAVKYSPYNKNIFVRLKQNGSYLLCEIQDEGPGLSQSDQQKLFGKFARLTPKPTGEEHSTGLGLFIVKKLVERFNEKVWCKSKLGQGSTFIAAFPINSVECK